jgi:RimJ/RimL family protein N-acetyltransferase
MTDEVTLRPVQATDLPIFFEQQLDPEATHMAAFPSRDHDAFMVHWQKILADRKCIVRTIEFGGELAGNIVFWKEAGESKVGYWLGRQFWGKGIASAALSQFLRLVRVRPLYARVAKHNAASLRVLQKCGFTISGKDTFPLGNGERGEEFVLVLAANDGDPS